METRAERIVAANKAYCSETEKNGIEICSWEFMPGWNDFVNGGISESQLSDQAKQEMSQFTRTFDKYTVKKESAEAEEESTKKQKAKAANKIYKKACAESGKSFCFFKNFTSWQEFVEGRLKDDEFFEKAVEEVQKMAEEEQ